MKRVTRPGGRVAACVWDMTGGMTMIRAYWDAAREAGSRRPGRDGALRRQARAARRPLARGRAPRRRGHARSRVSTRYQDFDELWQSFRRGEGPVGVHAASLEGEQHDAVRDALRRRVGSPDGPFELTASAWYAVGIV